MASSSSYLGATDPAPKAAVGPPTDDAHLTPEPSLNLEFMAMLAEELVAHLNHHRHMGDFVDVRRTRA